MRQIDYSLESSDIWLQQLHNTVFSILDGDTLKLRPAFGSGLIRTIKIQEGLFATITDVILKEPLVLLRKPKSENSGFVLNIYVSNSEVSTILNGKQVILGVNNQSVILSSATTSAELKFPINIPIKIFHIYFSRTWLLENGIDNESILYEPVTRDKPIYIIERIDYNFNKVREIIVSVNESINKIKLRSVVFQVLEHLILKLENRGNLKVSKLNPQDIANLRLVRKSIEDSIPNVLSNDQLAKMAKMSLAKFKRLFKQVFGTSPYQYHIEYKMNLALELLKTNEYSVSDVGYAIGYQNLGQFSKAFCKQHNILPKDVR